MPVEIAAELIKLVPNVLLIALLAYLVVSFHGPIKRDLIPRLTGFKALGLELEFASNELNKATEDFHKRSDAEISKEDREDVLNRARLVAPVLQKAQVLWVDDDPSGNINERKTLRALGVFVDLARSTHEAVKMLKEVKYDAVVSDMNRENNPKEGERFIEVMKRKKVYNWPIFYVRRYNPELGVPEGAFNITNRPDHLLHYVMDVLERERAGMIFSRESEPGWRQSVLRKLQSVLRKLQR
jgi:hypothetical protein